MPQGNQPVVKYRIGSVTATVWCNQEKFYNTVLSKSYKEGDEWRETDQLGHGDLLNAARVLKRAEEYISDQ